MTRFARKGGVTENKETKKKKQEATDWTGMFVEKKEEQTESATTTTTTTTTKNSNEIDLLNEQKRKHESDLNKRIEQENLNYSSDMSKAMQKYASHVDKEVLDDLLDMKKRGLIEDDAEFVERLTKEARSNRRRLTRQNERETTKICFKCRRSGHSVEECPEVSGDMEQAVGICYKCGSTEHSVTKCKVKVEPGKFPFAKCFICNEIGHITKQCPDNPRGLYPNGGCCKNCSSVTHFLKDCPEVQKQNLLNEGKTVKKIKPKENLEVLSDEEEMKQAYSQTNTNSKIQTKKVVLFK